MPALTPTDATILPRVDPAEGEPSARRRRRGRAVVPRRRGVQGRRATAGINLSLADPFLMLDHMGAVEYAPGEAKGAPDHPHRGFETVTYMMDGRSGTVTPTAGAGSSPTAPRSG